MTTTGRTQYDRLTIPPEPPRRGAATEDDANAPLVDLRRVSELLGYVRGALRRRRRVAMWTVAAVLALTALATVIVPRRYHVETKILAQRNVVLPMLGNPKRALPTESDTPNRLASEAVMNHGNLTAIIEETKLLENWHRTRAPLPRLVNAVKARIFGAPSHQDEMNALIGTLERNMWVTTSEGTVSIGILWPDPVMAHAIVLSAQQNFIEDRHASEVTTITESISILETHAQRVHDEIRTILDEMGAERRSLPTTSPAVQAPAAPTTRQNDARAQQLTEQLTAAERTIGDLEQFRARRLAELQAQLASQTTTYGPAHPLVESTKQSIRALESDSPQLTQLRAQARALESELARIGTRGATSAGPASLDLQVARAAIANMERARTDSLLEERQTYSRSRLKIAVDAYEDLLGRVEAARIELETTRAAFKYRYGILVPPQIPKKPMSPRLPLMIVGGLVLAMMLGLASALGSEIADGRIVEPWQLERGLGIPVLGEASLR